MKDGMIHDKAILDKFNHYLADLKKLPNFVRYRMIDIDNDFKLVNQTNTFRKQTMIRLDAYFKERIDEGVYRYIISQITLVIEEGTLNMTEEILTLHDELIRR